MNLCAPAEIAANYAEAGVKKSSLPVSKMLLLGVLAGMLIAFPSCVTNMASYGLDNNSTCLLYTSQGLRNIIIGIGGRLDGFMMESKFGIAVGSELMAILAVARDLKDLRERIGKIVVAYSRSGEPVTCEDLEVAGAMTAWMRNTINPTMCYSVEHQPVLVHAGPFANIAIGQSSVIADRLALQLFDYHVTESGFAADIGFEQFWNVKTRLSGLTPNAVSYTHLRSACPPSSTPLAPSTAWWSPPVPAPSRWASPWWWTSAWARIRCPARWSPCWITARP